MFEDPLLAAITENITLTELSPNEDVYLVLLESIVSQQLSVKASDTIFRRFLALFDNLYPEPNILMTIDMETLRGVGLSGQKAGYLKNVAQFALDKNLDAEKINALTDEEAVIHLSQIKGVGRWTAEMILMFSLCRPDVFPVDDLGIRQAMVKLYELDPQDKKLKARLTEIASNWRPHRSTACRYLWRWKDLPQ